MKTLSSKYTLLALVVLALGVGLLAVAPAQANIVYTDIVDVTIYNTELVPPDYDLPAGYDLDLNNDGTPDFNLNVFNATYSGSGTALGFINYTFDVFGQAAGMADPNTSTPTNFVVGHTYSQDIKDALVAVLESETGTTVPDPVDVPIIDNLAEGTIIGPSSNYISPFSLGDFNINLGGFAASAFVDASSDFLPDVIDDLFDQDFGPYGLGDFINAAGTAGQRGYVGFQFTEDGTVYYGWADVEIDYSNPINSLTIYGYAYENTGLPIEAGAVPIPASVLLLGSGFMGLGLLGWRRKSKG